MRLAAAWLCLLACLIAAAACSGDDQPERIDQSQAEAAESLPGNQQTPAAEAWSDARCQARDSDVRTFYFLLDDQYNELQLAASAGDAYEFEQAWERLEPTMAELSIAVKELEQHCPQNAMFAAHLLRPDWQAGMEAEYRRLSRELEQAAEQRDQTSAQECDEAAERSEQRSADLINAVSAGVDAMVPASVRRDAATIEALWDDDILPALAGIEEILRQLESVCTDSDGREWLSGFVRAVERLRLYAEARYERQLEVANRAD